MSLIVTKDIKLDKWVLHAVGELSDCLILVAKGRKTLMSILKSGYKVHYKQVKVWPIFQENMEGWVAWAVFDEESLQKLMTKLHACV